MRRIVTGWLLFIASALFFIAAAWRAVSSVILPSFQAERDRRGRSSGHRTQACTRPPQRVGVDCLIKESRDRFI